MLKKCTLSIIAILFFLTPIAFSSSKNLLYLKNEAPSLWTAPGVSGSQFREISAWQAAGYTVTTMNLNTTTFTATLLNPYQVVRIAGSQGAAISAASGSAISTWVNAGGKLFADIVWTNQVPAVSAFGVQTINGQNGGSTGNSWAFNGSPLSVGPVSGPNGTVTSIACEVMDQPVLSAGHSLTIDATISSYPAIVHGTFGSGKVVISFLGGWSHDISWPGNSYQANITQNSNLTFLNNVIGYFSPLIGIYDNYDASPQLFSLHQNYPNPFNPITNIRFSLKKEGWIDLKVFNQLGEEVAILVNETKLPGTYETTFNAKNLSSGVYFYRLQAGDFVETKKLILLK